MRYRAFRRKKDDLFYFQFLSEDNDVILNSQSYSDKDSCFNGIRSVVSNAGNSARYEKSIDGDGKHFFILKAGNGQEIGRSIKYDTEADLDNAIANFIAEGPGASSKGTEQTDDQTESTTESSPTVKAAAPGNEKIYKDYKPLSFYEENIAGTAFGFDPFEKDGAYYFTINNEGAPILISEDYTSESGRDNGISSVKKNVKNEKRYERKVHPNGNHYFNLIAGNKQEIATSRWFESAKEMEKAIYWLSNTGGTRKRKKASKPKKEVVERTYISQGQPYLCNNITYDTFQSGGNKKFYFVFRDKDNKAVLINGDVRGFETQEALEAGVKAVLEYGPKDAKYDIRSTKNGKPYFYIQDKDGKNIARSSLFYDSEEDMRKAMSLLQCVGATMVGAAPSAEKSEIQIDDYLPCERYRSEGPEFNTFYDEERKEFYFSYNDENGKVLLRSEGYTQEAARDNGIASVQKNALIEERWVKGTVLNGKYHYYALKAGNHQEIARSCYSDNEADMLAAFALTGRMFAPAPLAAASAPAKPEAVVDDYLPCARYAGDNGFHTFTNEENGEHYFSYNRDSDGKTLLRSEGYTSIAARDNGIASVQKNAPIEERWSTDTALNGKYHYFILKAGNHQEIARSCYYDDEAAMLADFGWIKGADSPIGAGSSLAGGAMMSANMLFAAQADAKAKADAEAEEARLAAEAKAKAEEEKAAAALAAAAAAKAAADAKAKADAEAKARAEEEARLAAEAKAKAEEEKAAAAALAAAAAAKAAADAKAKADAEAARLAAEAKAEKEKATAAALAAAAAATAATSAQKDEAAAAAAYAGGGGDEKSGCMKWLIPALIALALIALLLFLFKDCLGCKKAEDPVIEDPVIETPEETPPAETPEPYGKDGTEMGYDAGTLEYLMANHLSGYGSTFPSGKFDADGVTFSRNSSRLNAAARKQLDNVIALLKEYPDARIDIYGYLLDNESGTGNKEVSLDDDRAKAIYDYLKKGGIDASRMNFQGDGVGDRRGASIRITAR